MKDNLVYAKANALGLKTISYSQFSLFYNCPLSWYRKYVQKVKDFNPSIELVFGSAFHTVIQEYLTIYFNEGTLKADSMELNRMLSEQMKIEYNNLMKNSTTQFTNKDQMTEYYIDGTEILDFIKKHKKDYFDKNEYELFGIEYELIVPTDINPKIGIVGFLDIVLKKREKDIYFIRDFKTSFRGWKDNKKKDFATRNQVLLYKKYFAKQLNIPIDNVSVDFFILKRKLWESEFKQKHVQVFKPASGKVSMKKFEEEFNKFVNIFDENGVVKEGIIFGKASDKKNCKYCALKGTDNCNKLTKLIKHGESNNSD